MIQLNGFAFTFVVSIAPALPAAAQGVSAPSTVLIEAGDYSIGVNDGPASNQPGHTVRLRAFRIVQNRRIVQDRSTRGGDHTFDVGPEKLKVTFRDGFSRNPAAGHRHIGFRCTGNAR